MGVLKLNGVNYRIVKDESPDRCKKCDFFSNCIIETFMECHSASSEPHFLKGVTFESVVKEYFDK